MTGLQPGWEALPRTSAVTRTTSASGQAREETLSGVPLAQAFISPPQERVRIHCADGAALPVSAADAMQALLAPLPEGGWQVIFPQDATRRRRMKHPVAFILDEGV